MKLELILYEIWCVVENWQRALPGLKPARNFHVNFFLKNVISRKDWKNGVRWVFGDTHVKSLYFSWFHVLSRKNYVILRENHRKTSKVFWCSIKMPKGWKTKWSKYGSKSNTASDRRECDDFHLKIVFNGKNQVLHFSLRSHKKWQW